MTSVRPGVEISSWIEMKLSRSLHHLQDLQGRLQLWDAAGHTWLDLTLSNDRKTVTSVLRVDALPPLAEYSLILGDAVHNARSALDALAWELSHLNHAKPDDEKAIYFPIATRKGEWDDKGPRKGWATKLATIPEPYLTRIREVQPYNQKADPQNSGLAVLAQMSNQDKHRGMISASANANQIDLEFSIEPGDLGQSTPAGTIDGMDVAPLGDVGVLEDGRPFLKWVMSPRVTLERTRTLVGLAYTVDVRGKPFDLTSVLGELLQVRSLIYHVCNLPTPD